VVVVHVPKALRRGLSADAEDVGGPTYARTTPPELKRLRYSMPSTRFDSSVRSSADYSDLASPRHFTFAEHIHPATHQYILDGIRRTHDLCSKETRSTDLNLLMNLSLLAPIEPSVTSEVDSKRSGRGAGCGVFVNAISGREHPCFPAVLCSGEAVDPGVQSERQTRLRAPDWDDLPSTLQPNAPQDPKFEVRRHDSHYCKRTCRTLAAACAR
jgi:hypothetical protein